MSDTDFEDSHCPGWLDLESSLPHHSLVDSTDNSTLDVNVNTHHFYANQTHNRTMVIDISGPYIRPSLQYRPLGVLCTTERVGTRWRGGIFRVPNPNDPSKQVIVSFPVSPWVVHGVEGEGWGEGRWKTLQ